MLIVAAALGLHELRCATGAGEHAHAELAREAHGYLAVVTPVVALLVVVAAAHLAVRLGIARRSARTRRYAPPGALHVWWLASLALLTVSIGQELVEVSATAGALEDLGGVFAHGGWTAVPLAILSGGLVALVVRGSDGAFVLLSGTPAVPRRHELPGRPGCGHVRRPRAPLPDFGAERAPPAAVTGPPPSLPAWPARGRTACPESEEAHDAPRGDESYDAPPESWLAAPRAPTTTRTACCPCTTTRRRPVDVCSGFARATCADRATARLRPLGRPVIGQDRSRGS